MLVAKSQAERILICFKVEADERRSLNFFLFESFLVGDQSVKVETVLIMLLQKKKAYLHFWEEYQELLAIEGESSS